jgi:cell division protein FtsB
MPASDNKLKTWESITERRSSLARQIEVLEARKVPNGVVEFNKRHQKIAKLVARRDALYRQLSNLPDTVTYG